MWVSWGARSGDDHGGGEIVPVIQAALACALRANYPRVWPSTLTRVHPAKENTMGVFDFVKNGVREMMIARPDQSKSLIVFKHPDQNFPMYSQLTVDSDECAVFFKDGVVIGVLGPGRHTLQTQNLPFLGQIVNNFTGAQVFISELFFVKPPPVRGLPFGGPVGMMKDPTLLALVTPRIFGEMSVMV